MTKRYDIKDQYGGKIGEVHEHRDYTPEVGAGILWAAILLVFGAFIVVFGALGWIFNVPLRALFRLIGRSPVARSIVVVLLLIFILVIGVAFAPGFISSFQQSRMANERLNCTRAAQMDRSKMPSFCTKYGWAPLTNIPATTTQPLTAPPAVQATMTPIVNRRTGLMVTVMPSSGAQGTSFTIAAGGLASNAEVSYTIYSPSRQAIALETVTTDADGNFQAVFDSTGRDRGQYAVTIETTSTTFMVR